MNATKKITRYNKSIYLEGLTYSGRIREGFSEEVSLSWNPKDEISRSEVNAR